MPKLFNSHSLAPLGLPGNPRCPPTPAHGEKLAPDQVVHAGQRRISQTPAPRGETGDPTSGANGQRQPPPKPTGEPTPPV